MASPDTDMMTEILGTCREIDVMANSAYGCFADACANDGLKAEWQRLASEEMVHVKIWEMALSASAKGALPDLFDDAPDVLSRLKRVKKNIRGALDDPSDFSDAGAALSLGYQMESFMLDVSFMQVFDFLGFGGDDYERHVRRFIGLLKKYGGSSRQYSHLETLGDTLENLLRQNMRLADESFKDPLTGLLNRRGFARMIRPLAGLARRQATPVGLLICDIDRFKRVNDEHGHDKGDEVLRVVSGILQGEIRASDVLCRHGGEEFLIFSLLDDGDSLETACSRVNCAVREKSEDKCGLRITISLGGAVGMLGVSDADLPAPMLAIADEKLIEAKSEGRDCWRISQMEGIKHVKRPGYRADFETPCSHGQL
ncbi:MAG: GGDEF domain-containing protein [Victivallales bacterium]|nr:GGDEF domain-containing protein [Victivallales bacterium]